MSADRPEVDREVDDLLRALDHSPPDVPALRVIASARREARYAWLRWAAGIVLALALTGGVAYATPSSPLGQWLASVMREIGIAPVEREGPLDAPSPRPSSGPADAGSAGVAVAPGSGLTIDFAGSGLSGYLRVELTDGADVVVRTGTRSTRFSSEPQRLLVEHPSTDTVDVLVPRDALRIVIGARGRELFRKDQGEITSARPADREGVFLLSLGPGA